MEHNKGQLFHLTKMTELKRVLHNGWFWVNLFDTVKEAWQVCHIENPNLFSVILSGPLSCFKGHRESSGKIEWRPRLFTLTA